MADTDKRLAKEIEIENRFTDIKAQINNIARSILILTDMLNVAVYEINDMKKMIEEKENNNAENHETK